MHAVELRGAAEERRIGGRGAVPPGWSGGVTAVGTVHPAVPHGGLALPVVSPDGRWIAYLQHAEGMPTPTRDSLVTGRDLVGVTLWVRAVEGGRQAVPAALTGACWPVWSADSTALFFVTYESPGLASLGRVEVASGRVDRKTVGLRHLLAPSPSPEGSRVAVLTYDQNPTRLSVAVIDWSTADVTFAPRSESATAQLMPAWADAQSLLYVEYRAGVEGRSAQPGNGQLLRWRLADDQPPTVAGTLRLADSPVDALLHQQGLLAPFDPVGGRWLYRDASGLGVVLDLATQEESVLPPGTAAAAWWTPPWLLIGRGDAVAIHDPRPSVSTGPEVSTRPTDVPPLRVNLRLLDGRWAPRWVDPRTGSVVLVGRGDRPDRLALYQLWMVLADE